MTLNKYTTKLDHSCYLWIDALRNGYYAMRVTFTDGEGHTWAGVAWKDKEWNQDGVIVDKGKNGTNLSTTNEHTEETKFPSKHIESDEDQ